MKGVLELVDSVIEDPGWASNQSSFSSHGVGSLDSQKLQLKAKELKNQTTGLIQVCLFLLFQGLHEGPATKIEQY